MFTRIVMLMFIVTLALPVAALTRPGETTHAPLGDVAVAAKGKKHKQRKHRSGTRTVRGSVTQTFASAGPLTIPAGAPGTTKGPANSYPAAIDVSGLPNGVITDVDLLLLDFTHQIPRDVDILLAKEDGRRALVMSDVGSIIAATTIDLMLDDEAAASLAQQTELASGDFQPTDMPLGQPDLFPAPAPGPNGSVALSTFDGADPNGTWQLWVMDDFFGDYGDLSGWALQITAEVDVQVHERGKAKKHKKQGKKRR